MYALIYWHSFGMKSKTTVTLSKITFQTVCKLLIIYISIELALRPMTCPMEAKEHCVDVISDASRLTQIILA